MKLPGGARAVAELAKLVQYYLSENHPLGQHKARVLSSRFGFTTAHAPDLRERLLAAAATSGNAEPTTADRAMGSDIS